MQTMKHNGADVLYNVAKLPRKEGDSRFVFRVSFGGGVARHVDVPLEDYAWPAGGSGGDCTKHRLAMPAKALQAALGVVFGAPAPAAVPVVAAPVAAPAPVKPEKSEKHDHDDEKHSKDKK